MENEDRMCRVARREIPADVCYEIYMCLSHGLSPASVPEVEFKDDEHTEHVCERCPFRKEWE